MTIVTTPVAITDWDDAYANAAHIPEAAAYPQRWAEASASWRERMLRDARAELNIAYGQHERQAADLFLPLGEPRGLVVFVHGGYWMRFGRADWSHFAAGAVEHGYAVALPSYPLCPDASIAEITTSISNAVCHLSARVEGPVFLGGHSAGGHLVTRLICTDSPLPANVVDRLGRVLSISGVHDLVPLLHTSMNDTLKLDMRQAIDASPVRQMPRQSCEIGAWVGANERPVFVQQSQLLAMQWNGVGGCVTTMVEPGRHHFDVIDGLQQADSPMLDWWLE